MTTQSNQSEHWFAVQVTPRHEKIVATLLEFKGCVQFLPTYKAKRQWSDRTKLIEQPLCPGYVFSRFDRSEARQVLGTAGVIRIVSFGGKPCPIADEEIRVLQRVALSEISVRPHSFLKIGEKVQVKAGPLIGITGILTKFKNQERLILSVDVIMKGISLDIDGRLVCPLH
jgi:transcriptional antiterminator RfaH